MKFSFIGGDMRIVSLASALFKDGHEIACFALENAPAFEGMSSCLTLEGCVDGADCVVLPLPMVNLRGTITAPFSERCLDPAAVLAELPKSAVICGGKPDEELKAAAQALGLDFVDYFAREELAALNALATAEGALSIVLRNSPLTVWDSNVLIIGYGRIGKMLAERFRALGAHVAVSARRAGDMAYIKAAGCKALDTRTLGAELGRFDTIINTVPAPVLGARRLAFMKKGALCIDLASRPGGVDFEAARDLELNVIWALGLPAETAPETAGNIIKETVLNIMREKRGEI
jgi:dipicolinate synthase subunit A